LTQAEQKVDEMEKEFADISKEIRAELARFDDQRHEDLRLALIQYFEKLVFHEQQVLKCWESFVPETHAIIV